MRLGVLVLLTQAAPQFEAIQAWPPFEVIATPRPKPSSVGATLARRWNRDES
jgi:hypothetical protein